MLCRSCQQEIHDDARFCPHCGCPISPDGEPDAAGTASLGQRTRLIALAASLVAVLSAGFGLFSWHRQNRVEADYHAAQEREAETLAIAAEELLAQGDRMEAIQVAMAALPESATATDRPLVPSAQLALEHALEVYPTTSRWRSCYAIKEVEGSYALSSSGLQAFERTDGTIEVRSLDTGRSVALIDARAELQDITGSEVEGLKIQFCGDQLLCSSDGGMVLFDPQTGHSLWRAAVDGLLSDSDIAVAPDGTCLAIGSSFGSSGVIGDDRTNTLIVRVVNLSDGSVRQAYQLPLDEYADHSDTVRLAFSPNSEVLAVANSGRIWTVGLTTGEVNWTGLSATHVYELAYLDDSLVAISLAASASELGIDPAYVNCLSPELYTRWTFSCDPGVDYRDDGIPQDASLHLMGRFLPTDEGNSEDEGGDSYYYGETQTSPQIVLACGNTVRFLGEQTGAEMRQLTMDSPLRAAVLGDTIQLVEENGKVTTYLPNEDTTISDITSLRVAAGDTASLRTVDTTPYLAAYDASASTYRIYRYVGYSEAAGRTGLQNKYVHLNVQTVSDDAGEQHLMSWNSEELAALDPATFKRLWKRSFGKLGFASGQISCSCGKQVVYVYEAKHEGTEAPMIRIVDPKDGSILDEIELTYDWGNIASVHEQTHGDRTVIIVRSASTVTVIDTATHEELIRAASGQGELLDAWLGTDALLLLTRQAAEDTMGSFELYTLADNLPTAAAITDCKPYTAAGRLTATQSSDATLLVASCADGHLRAFSTTDWSVVWEGSEYFPSLHALSFSSDGQYLVAQDQSGIFLLLSAKDGQMVATSAATLPLLQGFTTDGIQSNQIAATYQLAGSADSKGLITISLDPESFGPTSETYLGTYYTSDGEQVLTYDATEERYFATYQRYSLDELLELARTTIEGHELTDAERQLYRID